MVTVAQEKSNQSSKERTWFDEVMIADIPLVGGKNASLGELIQQLVELVPNGFDYILCLPVLHPSIWVRREAAIAIVRPRCGRCQLTATRPVINSAHRFLEVTDAIINAYQELCDRYGSDTAVRSSATAEDLPDASFAGGNYLNVNGVQGVLEACRDASPPYLPTVPFPIAKADMTTSALLLRRRPKMVSDLACSGVMFSIDTETGFKNAALITAAYGLGKTFQSRQ